MKNNKENLYGWLFTYNPHTSLWSATTRDNYFLLFSTRTKEEDKLVLRSSSFKTLEEIIMKTNGDQSLIKKLVKF